MEIRCSCTILVANQALIHQRHLVIIIIINNLYIFHSINQLIVRSRLHYTSVAIVRIGSILPLFSSDIVLLGGSKLLLVQSNSSLVKKINSDLCSSVVSTTYVNKTTSNEFNYRQDTSTKWCRIHICLQKSSVCYNVLF